MIGLTAETPSEMLHLLVDGELDSSQEATLYNALASNDELKTQMRELLAIRESVHNDIEAYSTPASATRNVFTALGFAPLETMPVQAPTVIQPAATFMSRLISKMWAPALSAIGASLLTALLFMNHNKASVNYTVPNNFPVISSYGENTLRNDNGTIKNNSIIKNKIVHSKFKGKSAGQVIAQNFEPIAVEQEPVLNQQPVIEEENNSDNTMPVNSLLAQSNIDNMTYQPQVKSDYGTQIFNPANSKVLNSAGASSKDLGISFHIRGISAASYPSVNVNSEAPTMLSNIGLGLYTHLYKNLKIGYELGQEPFGLWYYNTDGINTIPLGKNPILLWSGISILGTFGDKLPYLGYGQPYAQIILGGTEIGPLGKGIVGLQFNPYNSFGFQFGLEGSLLIYRNQSNWFFTKKLGITYGMFINF